MATSPNDTVVTGVGASITDAAGNVWAVSGDGQITVNGQVDPTTANVDELAYYDGLVWQKNADNNWYSKTLPSAAWVQWPNSTAPVAIPNVSANDTAILAGGTATLTDFEGNVWGLTKGTSASGYQVMVDGSVDPTTANVIQMTVINGTIWQENAAGLWYSKTTPASAWSQGTTIDPITGVAEPVSLRWVGGGGNNASNPADWSPAVVPSAGDTLTMGSGTMNIAGNALAGDILTISPDSTVTINAAGNANLDLSTIEPFQTVNVNVAADATLTLTADMIGTNLTVSGGTISFIGTSTFDAFTTSLSGKLVGTGTLDLYGGNASGELMQVNGSVGRGLSFNISSNGAGDAGLQIDQPAAFQAAITMQQAGFVAFMGIQATSGDLLNGILDLYDGNKLVATARFADDANAAIAGPLQLQQNSSGVMLSIGTGQYEQPSGIGTALTLHT